MAVKRFHLLKLPFVCGLMLGTVLASSSCRSPFEIDGFPSRPIGLYVGQEVRVKLGTVGPGEYASPPTISSSAVRFLDVSDCCINPGGVVQVFRFAAAAPGVAIVVFHNTGPFLRVVEDTMIVR